MTLDEHLRVVPDLAERLDNPDPTTYVATLLRGVKFHDRHERAIPIRTATAPRRGCT